MTHYGDRTARLGTLEATFAAAIGRIAGETSDAVLYAAALAVRAVERGHVCLDLASPQLVLDPEEADASTTTPWPLLEDWCAALRASPLVATEATEDRRPLFLDARGRLYLDRYRSHEERLATALLDRARNARAVDDRLLDEGIQRLLASGDPDQQAAARAAVTRSLAIITGGPGTGKTSTVVRIAALSIEQVLARGGATPRIALLAPTGKAADRLGRSIAEQRAGLEVAEAVRAAIPESGATTIHRALGTIPGRPTQFRHDRRHPHPADIVIVDEASMVPLTLMARLFDAVRPEASIILLGDRDQLASVEAGAVLGDICGPAAGGGRTLQSSSPIAAAIVELRTGHRFSERSGIGRLADAVRRGDAATALATLSDPTYPDVRLAAPPNERSLGAPLIGAIEEGFLPLLRAPSDAQRLEALERFRILAAHRQGPWGVETLNRGAIELLTGHGLAAGHEGDAVGTPLLVTRNDRAAGLFNGDLGVVIAGPEGGGRTALFHGTEGFPRRLPLSRVPFHEPAFAMSVHKSQGSEVDHVAIILGERQTPLLTRELLYTAITRAKKSAVLYASPATIRHTINARVERRSGLSDRLWIDR